MPVKATNHTPGPWNLYKNEWNLGIYDSRGALVADLLGNLRPNAENKEANAKLIAAAPDLLNMLKEAWDCMHELLPSGDVENFLVEQTGNDEYRGILTRMRDVFVQVEGENMF